MWWGPLFNQNISPRKVTAEGTAEGTTVGTAEGGGENENLI